VLSHRPPWLWGDVRVVVVEEEGTSRGNGRFFTEDRELGPRVGC